MIVTLTLNPSLDRTMEVDHLVGGAVNRAATARLDPGGKGVNVSRALLGNGHPSCAVVTAGGPDGAQMLHLLDKEEIPVRAVPVASRTRSNVTIVEPAGVVTKLNEPGGSLSPAELDEVVASVLAQADGADWVVACGSLPPGVPADFYARLCASVAASGTRIAVDTSGPALPPAISAGPDLVKPNRDELAEAIGDEVRSIADVVEGCRVLRERGARAVLASLGADGAVLLDEDGVVTGDCPVQAPKSTVGAGDALLAGFLAGGAHGASALTEGLAWAAAAVRRPASEMPGSGDIKRAGVRIHPQPDTDRRLHTEPALS